MRAKLFSLLVAAGVLLSGSELQAAEPSGAAPEAAKADTFWFVPHTHWEGAVFKTREEYLDMGLANILRALRLLKAHPNYRFTLDQACYVKPFLERYPEQEAALRQFVAEGRLAIVGGTDVMADVNMPCGESFVRQILYGKGYFREKLGVDVTVGWQLDTFGHHAQMPQIMKLAGFQSFWFFRGVPHWDVPGEFLWQGIDGSQIPAYWLPQGYAITYGSPKTMPEFADFIKGRFDMLQRQSPGNDRVGLAGADVSEPEEHVPGMVEQFNRREDSPFQLRLAVPGDFEQVVARRKDRPVLEGELNPIFQGTYSSRIELKQQQRDLERLLITAEKLAAIRQTLGEPADSAALWRAWEPVLFNQAHDLASGVMTDRVYEDTVASHRFSKRLAEELVQQGLEAIDSRIDTAGEGIPVVVWNTLNWPRSDLAEVEIGFSDAGVLDVEVLDPAGQAIPVQLETVQQSSGGLLQAKIAFIARDVPATGYAVYRVIPRPAAGQSRPMPIEGDKAINMENEHYRVRLDPMTGAMTSLRVKSGDWEALSGAANVVACEHDGGDLWELYKPLDGGSRIAMTGKQPVPQAGKAKFSHEFAGDRAAAIRGPVFSQFHVAHPFGPEGSFATRVRLYAGLPRIEFRTKIGNHEKFVRYQVLFPTSIRDGRSVHEIPFGAIQRPAAIEYPAQNWIDYGDDQWGMTLLNRGLPGNLVAGGTMMLSLMRSTRIVAYGFGGGYEPGMSSDSGFELGKELIFDYALVPHGGPWQDASAVRRGLEFNHPLIVRKVLPHPGPMPNRWGLLEVSHSHLVVSALKPGPDGSIVLRVYESSGRPAPGVRIQCRAKIVSAEETNLMEDPGRSLDTVNDALQFDLGPFQIKTFKLQLAPAE